MRREIPIPGTTQYKLIQAGLQRFCEQGYERAEVDQIAADAGVTVGALYHHFKSKRHFYGVLRDDVTMRIVDRMEAVAESVPGEASLRFALLAAFDGIVKLGVGRLLVEPDPRRGEDPIARYLGSLAVEAGDQSGGETGRILAGALRAAIECVIEHGSDISRTRSSLEAVLGIGAHRLPGKEIPDEMP